MLVGACGNADGQVDDLAVPPVHAFRKLQQTHASGIHQVAGLRRAVGDGDALAEECGTLRFARLQALQIPFGDQAVSDQSIRQQAQSLAFVDGRLAHGYLLFGELEHDLLLLQPLRALLHRVLRYCCEIHVFSQSTALHERQGRQKN
ncbi:hypothetical protein D3C75_542060 [compost metagenome]